MTFKNFQGILNSTLTNEQGEIWVLFIVDGVQKFYLNATKIKNELNKVKKNMPCEVNFTVFFDANYIPELVAIQELNSGTYLSRSLFINKKYEDLKDSDNDSKKKIAATLQSIANVNLKTKTIAVRASVYVILIH